MTAQAKILERVRALIAKADGTNFPEEAASFRAKADELMTAYAIETWQVAAAQDSITGRPEPERRDFNIDWWRGSNPVHEALWMIFDATARHCRCVAVYQKYHYSRSDGRLMPVVGLPADLDYLDMLFTSLMLQLSKQVDPQPIPERGYMDNIIALKDAGLSWDEIAKRMHQAGVYPEGMTADDPHNKRRDRMLRQYRTYCKRTGHEQTYHHHQTYRRSFAEGFYWEIDERLRAMRNEQQRGYDAGHDGTSMAVTLRDISLVVRDKVYDLWEDLRPHEKNCQCRVCKERRKPVRYRADTRAESAAGYARGRQAGRDADIAGKGGAGLRKTPELPR